MTLGQLGFVERGPDGAMTSQEFALWRAYDAAVEPLVTLNRVARGVGHLSWMFANANRGEKTAPFELEAFDILPPLAEDDQPAPDPRDDYAKASAVMVVVRREA
jgi:hypothetical protein